MTDANVVNDVVDYRAVVVARERFLDICCEWADELIENGVMVRRGSGATAKSNIESLMSWVPKVAHVDESNLGELRVSIVDLPEAQLRVWRAAYHLIVDAFTATSDYAQVPHAPVKVDGIYTLVTRDMFVDEHRLCGYSVCIDWSGRKVVCARHLVCALFVD